MVFYVFSFFLIIFKRVYLSTELEANFKNQCGPYANEETDQNPSIEDCINDNTETGNDTKCCYVEGYINLTTRSTCVNVSNTTDGRIEMIDKFSEFATGIKVECGQKKVFSSTCGNDNPKERNDCFKYSNSDYDCCYIYIKSKQFTGSACRKYKNIDQNNIGEAVTAAKTVAAELEVDCFAKWIFLKSTILILFVLI